ncbi:hypothetical protein BM527_01105 [Alteromonas sp. Mex14]|nr:hypothetical protein BM527_01105 [Alteromonas sp. Mex14]
MATTSFDKKFVVCEKEAIIRVYADLKHPSEVDDSIRNRDINVSGSKGLSLLKRTLRSSNK